MNKDVSLVYSSYSVRALPDQDGFLDVGNLDKDLETIFPAEKETIFSDPI